jgi:hypothetical protein
MVTKSRQSLNIKIRNYNIKRIRNDDRGGGDWYLLEQNNVEMRTEAGDLSICLAQTPIFLYPFYLFFDDGQPEGWHLQSALTDRILQASRMSRFFTFPVYSIWFLLYTQWLYWLPGFISVLVLIYNIWLYSYFRIVSFEALIFYPILHKFCTSVRGLLEIFLYYLFTL